MKNHKTLIWNYIAQFGNKKLQDRIYIGRPVSLKGEFELNT